MRKFTTGIIFITASLLVGCSGSTKDVRLTLCEDLTIELLEAKNTQIQLKPYDIHLSGYEDLEVRLGYVNDGAKGTSVCFYSYDTVDENAMTQSNPASAFSTYPSKMIFNDKVVDRKLLAAKVNSVLVNQGKAALSSIKEKL